MSELKIHLRVISSLAMFLLLLYCSGCARPELAASRDETVSFPNSVGSFWEYQVLDSNNQIVDTVRVEIVGTLQIKPGEFASIWKHQKSDSVWYRYIRVTKGRVIEYPQIDGSGASIVYRYPMTLGREWISNPAWNDTSRVEAIDSTSNPAFEANHAFYVVRHWETAVSSGNHDTWLVPNIGIVRSNLFRVSGVDSVMEKWELIECSVVQNGDSTSPSIEIE